MKLKPFAERLRPALRGAGFMMDDYWVWCGSVVQGEDGRYHMFASRWPKEYPFFHGYLAASEIVRASADTPEGPYQFDEVILSDRGSGYWDGRMRAITHTSSNMVTNTYYFILVPPMKVNDPAVKSWMNSVLVVMDRMVKFSLVSQHPHWCCSVDFVFGPWQRPDEPTFNNNPDGWDNGVVTNPAPCLAPDGRILLYYRSHAKLGVAIAADARCEFKRVGTEPIIQVDDQYRIEDPCIWWQDDHFEMVCKDLSGGQQVNTMLRYMLGHQTASIGN